MWEAGITHSPFRASAGRLSAHPEVNSGWILLTKKKGFMRYSTRMPSVGSLFLALCNYFIVLRGHKDRKLLHHTGDTPRNSWNVTLDWGGPSPQDYRKRDTVSWSSLTSVSQTLPQLWCRRRSLHCRQQFCEEADVFPCFSWSQSPQGAPSVCEEPWACFRRMNLRGTGVLSELFVPMAAQLKFLQTPWNEGYSLI